MLLSLPMTALGSGWTKDDRERTQLHLLSTGALLEQANNAIAEFGHGTLRDEQDNLLHIGGSTGGRTRKIVDDYIEPDVEKFFQRS